MKHFSRFLFCILGIILLGCVLILLTAINPSVAKTLSRFTHTVAPQVSDEPSESDVYSSIDIEQILVQIEERERIKKNEEAGIFELGLINDTVHTTLDSYYDAIIGIIRENYKEKTELIFDVLIDESIFNDWYSTNYKSSGIIKTTSYTLTLNYTENTDGSYLITHKIDFN